MNNKKPSKKIDLSDRIKRRTPRKKIIEQDVDNKKSENTFSSEIFPIIIMGLVIIVFGIFYYLFSTYKEVLTVDSNGYFISNNDQTLLLGTKKNSNTNNNIKTVNVKENDIVYKTALNHYLDNDKNKNVNILYPLFINKGLSIINYNEDINLINNKFDRSEGYNGLLISYGKVYDTFDYTQIDKENYLLLSYSDNVMVNLYDLKIKTTLNEYIIPVNSFVYFEKNSIGYYEKQNNKFVYKSIDDIDYKSNILFYYDGSNEEYKYDYETFLNGIGTVYIAKTVPIEEEIEPDKPKEEHKKPDNKPNNNNNADPGKLEWAKPSVTISNISASVYSLKANLQINDIAGVIVKSPTFTLYRNNKTYLKRSYYGSGDICINGLAASTTFSIVGQYTYLAEDMETRILVTFYSNKFTTKSLSNLDPIDLDFKNGDIYSKKIEIEDIKVVSDLQNEAIKGINKLSLNIEGKDYYLTNGQINTIINGIETSASTSEGLPSSSKINYSFKFYDRDGNLLNTANASGSTRTSMKVPNISLRIKKSEVDEVLIGINTKNEDEVELNNYIYVIKNSIGKIIKQDKVDDSTIALTDLDPDQLMNITLYADIDIDDGKGLQKNYELVTMDFTSKPITTLGYINLSMETVDLASNSTGIDYSINIRKTNSKLTKLLTKLTFEIYDELGETLIDTKDVTGDTIESIKKGETSNIKFENLLSNTKYKIVVKTTVKQGETTYELGTTQTLDNFTTNKTPAKINVTNSFTTETMIDFDVNIVDEDGTVESGFVRLELRDKDNKIIDTRKIGINESTPTRITYNNLNTNVFYNIYFYADEYNETSQTSTYKTKYLLKEFSIYTESGISGKVELVSSLRVSKGQNIADVKSEVKWVESTNYYTIPKTIDKDGNMHIYSKTGASSYMYDLTEYHGEFVTVSFKMKTIVPVDPSYKLYFSQYISGTTSTAYSKEITGLSEEAWTSYTYTFKVGTYYGFNDIKAVRYPYTGTTYGKNNTDFAGFYITNGTANMAEYAIKDFEIHVQYDKVEYDYGNVEIEQGSWGTAKDYTKAKSNSDYYVRMSQPILLEGNANYSFEFDSGLNYKVYIYQFNKNGTYEKAYGWYNSELTIYVPEDKYIRIWFDYRDAKGIIKPEDIKNFKIYKYTNNNQSGYTDYEYDLVTKIKIDLNDKRDEITTNDYYIKIYENGSEVKSYNYVDLIDTNKIEKLIKNIELDEHKDYKVELGIKIRDRYYSLHSFDLSTEDEVLGLSTTDDWVYIQPYGNYILLNDMNFQNFTDQRIGWGYRYFHGVIDFQGYTIHQYTAKTDGTSNTSYIRIYRIEKDAVLKNLVLDVNLNNQELNGSVYGFVEYNYGTIENVELNITDTMNHKMPQYLYGLLAYYNGLDGVIKNFVVKLNGDVHMYSSSAILARENYGLIENGYVYGGDVVVDFDLVSGTSRQVSILQRYGGVKSKINKVYTTSSIVFPNKNTYDFGGIYAYETYGEISNVYAYGDTNPDYPQYGPIVNYERNTTRFDNVFYISKNIYTSKIQEKASLSSLRDVDFQKNILGNGFNTDDMIPLGFYPQVKYSSNKMPNQEYVELPEVNVDEYADIVYMDVEEQTNNSATINVSVNNPSGEEVTDIQIADLDTNIVSQSYAGGKSTVIIEVSNPSTYISKYQVRQISTTSANGYVSTRKYSLGEKYLLVEFYREILTVQDFIKINSALNQNYKLMNDLDFEGYSNFYINNFVGNFDGNNHIIKNVRMITSGKNGLFNQMNGTMKNLTFENIYISKPSSYQAIIGYSNQYSKYYNVHVKNITIELTENIVNENMYVGALIGYAYSSSISYCSASDVNIKSVSKAAGLTVGGLIGNAYGVVINNSFARKIDINISNAISSNGVGGLIGRESWSTVGYLSNCYATGKINTNSAPTGGLVGQSFGYISSSFSSVDVTSDMSFIGGMSGSVRLDTSAIEKSLYLGNLYSGSTDNNIHRISGNYLSASNNFAMKESLVNGAMPNEEETNAANGASLVTYDDLLKEQTYKDILLSDEFDYSKSHLGILPKLYSDDKKVLMPNQEDEILYKNMFNVDKIVMDKHAKNAMVTLYLENKDKYTITDITVEDANIEINKNILTNTTTVLEFNMTPTKFFDTYRISSIKYLDANGEEQVLERNIRIDAVFYKELATVNDWNNISNTEAENYLLVNDIDFTGETNINTKVMFNRLETAGPSFIYSIKGIDLTFNKNANYVNLIQSINTSLKNIKFEDINITNNTTSGNNYNNLLLYNYGTIDNVEFNRITIDAPSKYYVAIIGRNYGNSISNITLKTVNVNGQGYVASFISQVDSTINDNFDNINADDIHINATRYYVGGIFAYFINSISYADNPIYNNINISNSEVTGGQYYIGGVSGMGDCNHCVVDNVKVKGGYYVGGAIGYERSPYQYDVTVKNSNVEGSQYYIGGIYGYSYLSYDGYLINSTVSGTKSETYGVGGITGYKSNGGHMYRSGVIDSTITNLGDRTGGLIGYYYYSGGTGYLYSDYVTDSKIIGGTKTGGLVGTATAATYIRFARISNSTIISTDMLAGAIAGQYDNNNDYGSHSEGYIDEVTVENCDVQANHFAGGFFGGASTNLYYANRVRRLYFSGTVTATDGSTYGLATGDQYNSEILNQPRVYVYEKAVINNSKISDVVASPQIDTNDILLKYKFYPGYIDNSGKTSYNESDVNATYSDLIEIEENNTYQLDVDYATVSDTYRIYLYNAEGTFVSQITSSSVENYIDKYFSTSYSNGIRFRAHKDCYIRINIIAKAQVKSMTLRKVKMISTSIEEGRLLSASDLRSRLTWAYNIGNTSAINSTKLNYSTSYWDISPVNSSLSSITVKDKINDKEAVGKVSSVTSNGILIEGTGDKLEIDDYKIPTTALTISSRFTPEVSWPYQSIFSSFAYGSGISGNGVGLFVHYLQLYIWINGSYYNTNYYLPMNKESNVTVTYFNKKIDVYVEGEIVHTRSTGALAYNPNSSTFIGWDQRFAPTSTSYRFVGNIKNVMVYNRALEEEEISANNKSSTGITNDSGLELYYDFTNTNIEYDSYYPIVKWSDSKYSVKNQRLVSLPNEKDEPLLNAPLMATRSLYSSSLSNNYHVYSSGIDTINLEFDNFSKDMSFIYKANGKEYTSKVTKKTYTLSYDYNSDIEIIISNAYESKKITFTKDNLARKISYTNGKYYYISNNNLYCNDKEIINGALNIKDNLVLLSGNKVYNINTNDTQDIYHATGILSTSIPLYQSKLNDKIIKTYYNYTLVGTSEMEGQLFIKNNQVFLFNSSNTLNDNIVFNEYNTEEYQIVLKEDGKLSSYKAGISFPETFVNDNIAQITFDINSGDSIMMLMYKSGNVLVFNYVTGEELYRSGTKMSATIFEFVNSSLSPSTMELKQSSSAYIQSKELLKSLSAINDSEINELIDTLVTKDNTVSNKLSSEYVSAYNSISKSFEVYNVNEVIAVQSKSNNETNVITYKNDKVVSPISDKIKTNSSLYNYFYDKKTNTNIKDNKTLIYGIILVIVIINLFVLSYIYNRKEALKDG